MPIRNKNTGNYSSKVQTNMPRGKSSSNSKGSGRSKSKSSTSDKLNSSTPGRPKPMTPSAGVTVNRRRYDKGGKWCW